MTQDELRSRVRDLLLLESAPVIDWQAAETGCALLSEDIAQMPTGEVPDLLWHFLDDADIRQHNVAYANEQREPLWSYVETGEMVEHAPSVAISPWGCLAAILAMGSIAAWLFR